MNNIKIFIIISLVTAVILAVISLLFAFEKIDIENFIENNKNIKNKRKRNIKKILNFINFIMPIFIILMLILLGAASYLWGRYFFC